jgi:hypothetical protein
MDSRRSLTVLAALVSAVACRPQVDTLPKPVSPTDPVQYYDLEVPPGLDIRAVDFSASTFSDASGPPGGSVSSTIGGRAFIKVYAVRRATGEQLLLLYEDIARRPRPIQIIRFRPAGDAARPDSAR